MHEARNTIMTNNVEKISKHIPTESLKVKRMGIDTHHDPIIYLNKNNAVSRSEGFAAMSRVCVSTNKNSIIATVNVVNNQLLDNNQVGLSEVAWKLLKPSPEEAVKLSHTKPVDSFAYVRGKLFGKTISEKNMFAIIKDIVADRYTQVQLSAFILACINDQLSTKETCYLTEAMVQTGDRLNWPYPMIMDKHCVGGLPGNRTTPIIVAIVSACGLIMPKTSSRAITSPAGTADTMEVITNVNLTLEEMKKVVETENGCLTWGGTVNFSPSDDKLIQIERALEIDSEGQMVSSILSKKLAAGSTHVVIDIPVGPSAKVRNEVIAKKLSEKLITIGKYLNLSVLPLITSGMQPIGKGVGPVWEMLDIIEVLTNKTTQAIDLRERATYLAGAILEMGRYCPIHHGQKIADEVIANGKAWKKFQAICEAQGGMKEIPKPKFQYEVLAPKKGVISYINNRFIARLAKFSGAPLDKAAGIQLDIKLGNKIEKGDKLFTLYSESKGELNYALTFLDSHPNEIHIEDERL